MLSPIVIIITISNCLVESQLCDIAAKLQVHRIFTTGSR